MEGEGGRGRGRPGSLILWGKTLKEVRRVGGGMGRGRPGSLILWGKALKEVRRVGGMGRGRERREEGPTSYLTNGCCYM